MLSHPHTLAIAIYGSHPLGWHPPIYLAMDNTHIYVGQPIERVQRPDMRRRPYRDAHEVKIGRTPVPVPLRVLARGRVQLTGFFYEIVGMRSSRNRKGNSIVLVSSQRTFDILSVCADAACVPGLRYWCRLRGSAYSLYTKDNRVRRLTKVSLGGSPD